MRRIIYLMEITITKDNFAVQFESTYAMFINILPNFTTSPPVQYRQAGSNNAHQV